MMVETMKMKMNMVSKQLISYPLLTAISQGANNLHDTQSLV
jgi:hypothetical protein